MPSPKSGSPGSAITPAGPKAADEADSADPGEVEKVKAEQRKTQTGKYGTEQTKAHKPPGTEEEDEEKKSWIEIEMVGEDDKPVGGVAYRVTLPDDTVAEGTLDERGFARIDGIEPGNCNVTFPRLDQDAWKKV
jgi:hypothetical protein